MRPTCSPEKWRVCPSQVPSVTYQTPQMKYSKNIITDSRSLICKSTPLPPVVIRASFGVYSFCSSRSGLPVRGTVEPKVDGLFRVGSVERHCDFSAFASRSVARVQRVQHDQAVLAGRLRFLLASDAASEMGELLRRAVIPEFFKHWITP